MPRAPLLILATLVLVATAHLPAGAQIKIEFAERAPEPRDIARPPGSGRIVRVFDFEGFESDTVEVPIEWYRPQSQLGVRDRPGYPLFNRAQLDYNDSHSGRGSMMLPTRGGSTGLRLVDGIIPVFPDADYLVSAWVKTTALEYAGAVLSATLITSDGQVIEGSVARTEPIISKDSWTQVRLAVLGEHPQAAFMRLDLDLVQRALVDPRADTLDIRLDDFVGAAWFDDVVVQQIPRVELTCGSDTGLLERGALNVLRVHIRDLTGDDVRARLSIYDSRGAELSKNEVIVPGGNYQRDFVLSIDRLGWYRAVLRVMGEGGAVISSNVLDFALLEAPGRGGPEARERAFSLGAASDRDRFVAAFGRLTEADLGALAAMAVASGAGEVRVTLWHDTLSIAGTEEQVPVIARFVNELRSRRVQVGVLLARVPESVRLAGRIAPDDPVMALTRERDTWGPWLLPVLDRLGQYVLSWQFGTLGDFGSNLRVGGGAISAARDALDPYVPGGQIIVPWPGDVAIDRGAAPGADRLAIAIPPGFGDEGLDTLARQVAASRHAGVEVYLVPLDPHQFGHRASQDDLARRLVAVWDRFVSRGESESVRSARLIMDQPWALAGAIRTQVTPAYMLPVWRTCVQQLDGRRVVARFSPRPGVHAFVLGPATGASSTRSSALILFRDPGVEETRVTLPLGFDTPTLTDINGNRAELVRRADWLHDIQVGASPVFVENVDAPLLTFLSSIRFSPGMLPPGAIDMECEAVFPNPWNVSITGGVTIVEPGGFLGDGTRDRTWSIRPFGFEFFTPPGGERAVPITMGADARVEIGRKRLVVDIKLTAEREYPTIRHEIPFDVGVAYMNVNLEARVIGEDVVVDATIENRDERAPLTLELSASAADQPKSLATVSSLPPRQRTVRSFLFSGASARLAGSSVSVSILDRQRQVRLFKSVELPPAIPAGIAAGGR